MRILGSQIALQAQHSASQYYRADESLQMSAGQGAQSIALDLRRSTEYLSSEFSSYQQLARHAPASPAPLTRPGLFTMRLPLFEAPPPPAPDMAEQATVDEELGTDHNILLLKLIIEMMSGHEIKIARVDVNAGALASATAQTHAPATQPGAQFSVDYSFSEFYRETESLSFRATGTVQTADGRSIAFDLALFSERSFESSTRFELHAGQRKDPLLINLQPGGATLSDQTYAFDLNGDGQSEQIAFATGASAFLALDLNGNGRIDNGGELFGTQSGNGFADLSRYDEDGNGFIDAGDSAFTRLLAYSKDQQGQDRLASLQSLGVGALYLGSASGDFDLRNSDNQSLGRVRSSGLYLNEDGSAGSLQQVDLVV